MRKTKIIIDKAYRVAPVDDRMFGSFIEHLGKAVYGGILRTVLRKASWNVMRLRPADEKGV